MKSSLSAGAFFALVAFTNLPAQESMMDKPAAPAPGTPTAAATATAPAKPMSRAEEILRRFDKNGDGRLDDDEKADAHEMMLQEQMAKSANPAATPRGLDAYQALALEVFDRNHDGRLDDNERRDGFAFVQLRTDGALTEVLIKRFDKNKDGLLDEAERKESQAYAEEHRGELMQEALLKRFDKNANSQLDPDEKTAIREAFAKAPVVEIPFEEMQRAVARKYLQGEGRELLRAVLLKRFDANGNGELDPDEQLAAQEFRAQRPAELFNAVLLQRFDKNGDGRLDEAERATVREVLSAFAAANPPAEPAMTQGEKAEEKKLDPARAAALAAEIERRRAAREERTPASAAEEKK